jgi:hypothetical protein
MDGSIACDPNARFYSMKTTFFIDEEVICGVGGKVRRGGGIMRGFGEKIRACEGKVCGGGGMIGGAGGSLREVEGMIGLGGGTFWVSEGKV